MKNAVSRDIWGKVQGGLSYFWNDEDESYKDQKEKEIRYPVYKGNMNGEVRTYHISELK